LEFPEVAVQRFEWPVPDAENARNSHRKLEADSQAVSAGAALGHAHTQMSPVLPGRQGEGSPAQSLGRWADWRFLPRLRVGGARRWYGSEIESPGRDLANSPPPVHWPGRRRCSIENRQMSPRSAEQMAAG